MNQVRHRTGTGLILAAAVLVAALGLTPPAGAGGGQLDPGFGETGKVAVLPPAGAGEVAYAAALLPDGRLVVAGMAAPARYGYAFLSMRFTADGRLDPTFGTGGRVWTDLVTVTSPLRGAVVADVALGSSAAYALAVQPDGRLVLGGTTASGGSAAFALLRYLPDGDLDPDFGEGGMVVTDLDPLSDDVISALALLDDGRILAAGRAGERFALARYRPDGALDPTFATEGVAMTGGGLAAANAVLLDPEGRAVVSGQGHGNPLGYDFAVARYLPDGGLDPSFGVRGRVLTDLGTTGEWATGVVREPDGGLLVAGTSGSSFALVRHLADGRLDPDFGEGGVVKAGPGIGSARALVRQADGRLLLAGGHLVPESPRQVAVARYHAGGFLDAGFGISGVVGTDVVPGRHDEGWSALAQPDGKLVVAGTSLDRENRYPFVILVRYADVSG